MSTTQLKHIISTSQFDRKTLEKLFSLADKMEKLHKKGKPSTILAGKIMSALFYEPSTRTRLSFETAMLKLGGQVISTENAAQFSSAAKGETLEDSIRVINGYADVIVLRHYEDDSGERAAAVSQVPIISGGSGKKEHPTQGLLDMYTIRKEMGKNDNLYFALMGDLKHSRTIHEQINLISLYKGNRITLVSPKSLALPEEYKKILRANKVSFDETEKLSDVISTIDVLSVNRVQKERLPANISYEKIKDLFIIDMKTVSAMKKKSIVIDPLPRIGTILPEVDSDPRAAYFRQAQNGLYIRMALLHMLLKK